MDILKYLETTGEDFEAPHEEGADETRRAILKLIVGSAAGVLVGTAEPDIALATPPAKPNPWAVAAYNRLRQRVDSELDAGPASGTPLEMALNDLPRLYYDHDATKIEDAQHHNVPSPSMSFEFAKLVWFEMRERLKSASGRDIILDKLRLAAQPGVPIQQRLQSVFTANYAANSKLRPYYQIMERDANALVRSIQALVLKERSAAKAMKTPSAANAIVNAESLAPTVRKSAALSQKHSAEFDKYEDIEDWLRPYPYACDVVSPDFKYPSSIVEVEAVKALKAVAERHLIAAIQRKEAYHAIQSFVQLTGQSARPLLKYDGTRHNDPILYGWLELLRETPDENRRKGQIPALLDRIIYTVRHQSTTAEAIKRCLG